MPRDLDPRETLREAADSAGLLPEPGRYALERARITAAGEAEREWIIARLGRRTWTRGVRALARPHSEDDAIRVLGFGRALTAFAAAPAGAPETALPAILHLGALANFLVATFDHFLDRGQRSPFLIPRWLVAAAARQPASWTLRLAARAGPAHVVLLRRLMLAYFEELEAIATPGRAQLHRACGRVIVRMYEAEVASLQPAMRQRHLQSLRRKNALPFVVMGLPAWLVAPELDPVLLRRHLTWLCRLGSFVGGVDDAVDIAEDAVADRPNRVAAALASGQGRAGLMTQLARRGRRVVDDWQVLVPSASRGSADGAEGLRVCLASWLGGMPDPSHRAGMSRSWVGRPG